VLIVGCGNEDRCDDGAGVLVARRLRELGIDAREHGGEGLSLLEAFTGCERVVLVDATVSGQAPGTITLWDQNSGPLPAGQFQTSSHAFGVAEAVELARALERLPASITVYGIEAARFDTGGSPSPEVLAAVEQVAQEIAREAWQCTNRR
jgi:hydrogenase maturation protease